MKKVSIIIPTLDRKDYLLKTLKSISGQSYKKWELIIVDDSKDQISKEETGFENLKIIRSKGKGSPAARNAGLSVSEGDIAIFIDDDVEVGDPNFIEKHVRNYTKENIGGVAGRAIKENDHIKPKNVRKTGEINYITGNIIGSFNGVKRKKVDHAVGCNMSFRRSLLAKIGGFDESFGGNAYFEEVDVSLGIKKLGYSMVFSPDASLFHHQAGIGGNRQEDLYKWRYWYFHNHALLFLKHFNRFFLPIFLAKQFVWILGSGLKRKDFKMIKVCLSGLTKGFKTYKKENK